jgi:hypothetical protein
MTLRSGFAVAAVAGGCVSMVTDGPPSVAIFVEAMSACGEARALIASDATGAASLIGGNICSVAAILVSLAAAGASAAAGAASLCAGLSGTGISGFVISGAAESSGFSAAMLSGSATGTAAAGSAGAAATGTLSDGFGSAGGGSTRSIASTGLVASILLRKNRFGTGVPRWRAGNFFMSRAEQRRRTKPEDQYRHRQHDRGEQKTEAGQHREASSTFAGFCKGLRDQGNAVNTEWAAFATHSESGWFENTATVLQRLLKIGP